MDHWSRDPLLLRRVLLGGLITAMVLLWSVPPLVLVTLSAVAWPLGALEASSALQLRRARSLARVAT